MPDADDLAEHDVVRRDVLDVDEPAIERGGGVRSTGAPVTRRPMRRLEALVEMLPVRPAKTSASPSPPA